MTDTRDSSIDHAPRRETALVLHPVRSKDTALRGPQARLQEAVGLAEALDLEIVAAELAPLRAVVPATLFGKGKVEEFRILIEAKGLDVVVVDDALSPVQQRNLEKAWNTKVVDRTGLILEIFGRRARTREGRLQVQLARLEYERSRLVRTWTHLERQAGGTGKTGGPGETQIELDRRQIADRIVKLKRELEEVRRTRTLHRTQRKKAPHPTVALVGYTNAGKSTLFNRLTQSTVMAEDMLFATLDPTLRTVALPNGRPAILSDTVGFISDLPHQLVEAFRATLEEVQEADVILHVRDVAGEDSEAQAADVGEVLNRLKADADHGRVLVEVWNKLDLIPADERDTLLARAGASGEGGRPRAVAVSAVTGEGCEALLALVAQLVDPADAVEVRASPGQGEVVAWLYQHGRVTERADEDDGAVRLSVRLNPQALGRFERMFPDASLRSVAH